jgi:Methyltransferase domain
MHPFRAAALKVPAIRRLYDERNRLLIERDSARAPIPGTELAEAKPSDKAPHESDETKEAREARAEGRIIITEYPYFPKTRAIENAAGGRRLSARLKSEEGRYAATLSGIAKHIDKLVRIPRRESNASLPFWENDWFPPFDGASLYGLLGEYAPQQYIEVGSGISTRFARRAISDLGLQTRIVAIDPHPHNPIEALCDEVIVSRMEDVLPAFWESIGPRDLLFIDNSHRSFSNSDVTVFFTEVLPMLPPGVVWGLHDILLPWDYPPEWRDRFYNEQYLLLAYLLGGGDGDEIILPVRWATSRPSLHAIMNDLWARTELLGNAGTHGGCFWMRRGGGARAGVS